MDELIPEAPAAGEVLVLLPVLGVVTVVVVEELLLLLLLLTVRSMSSKLDKTTKTMLMYRVTNQPNWKPSNTKKMYSYKVKWVLCGFELG